MKTRRKVTINALHILVPGLICLAILVGLYQFIDTNHPNYMIGAWHKDPSIAAGYSERYSFYENGTYMHAQAQKAFDSKDISDKSTNEIGRWEVTNDELTLFPATGSVKEIAMPLGSYEKETDSNIVYEHKMKINNEYFWQLSKNPKYWDLN